MNGVGEYSWDNRVVERLLDKLKPSLKKVVMKDKRQTQKLLQQVDAAKVALWTGSKRVTMRVRVAGESIQETLSYESLSQHAEDILGQFKGLTEQVLAEAGAAWESLDHVLLAGSGARMPFVHKTVKRWSGDREICSLAGPEVASGGAALLAENSIGTRNSMLDFLLQDCASYSYGIRSIDPDKSAPAMQVVASRNSPLPITKRATIAKHSARQFEINFEVVELDESNPTQPTVLGKCSIRDLPPGLPVGVPIEVEFTLDSRGILSVHAISLATGRRMVPLYQTTIGMNSEERTRWRAWLQALQ
jgi:molecular chaperone DnaK (HSP70)